MSHCSTSSSGVYQGQSLDDEVLFTGASELGVKYLGEKSEGITIVPEKSENLVKFVRKIVLEFDSGKELRS